MSSSTFARCPRCDFRVYRGARKCPKCGRRLRLNAAQIANIFIFVALAVAAGAIAWNLWFRAAVPGAW